MMGTKQSSNDLVYRKFIELVGKHFPYFNAKSSGYIGMNFNYQLPHDFRQFKNSPYFYHRPLKFVHWTSFSNLFSIINNREIRLYNLHNSEDGKEFEYGALLMNPDIKNVNYLKDYYYSFSCCEEKDLYNKYLWEIYGRKFSGAAIEFSLENNLDEWKNYMLSKVYYGFPEAFQNLKQDLISLENEYDARFRLDFGKIWGFHKMKEYADEEEIRLGIFFPYTQTQEYLTHTNIDYRIDNIGVRNRETNYISLPLFVDNTSTYIKNQNPELDRSSKYGADFFKSRPTIKITNIHLGCKCGLSSNEFRQLRNKIMATLRYKFGYKVDINLNMFSDDDCKPSGL